MTSKEEIIGTVEAVNREKGKEGLKLKEQGKWYNAGARVAAYWQGKPNAIPRAGAKMKLELVDGKLDFVRPYQEGEEAGFQSADRMRQAASPAKSAPEKGVPSYYDPAEDRKAAVPAIVWELKDWSAMRGGLSHDAALIVTTHLKPIKELTSEADIARAVKYSVDLTIEVTEQLVAAAEKAKEKKRNELELGSLKPAGGKA